MGFYYQLTKYNVRSLKTGLLCFMFVGLGAFVASFGPSLLDLQMVANVSIKEIALVLPARSFGYAAGSVAAGIIGDRFNHQLVLMACTFFGVITTSIVPICSSIVAMYIFSALAGTFNGCIDTLGNVWIIHLWGTSNPPFMQIVHFAFGVGAFIAPFLIEPFLSKLSLDSEQPVLALGKSPLVYLPTTLSPVDNLTALTTTLSPYDNSTSSDLIIMHELPSDLRIHWPFLIMGAYNLLVLIAFGIVYYLYPDNEVHPSRTIEGDNEDEDDKNKKKDYFYLKEPITGRLRLIVIIISIITMHSYVGLEISFGSLLPAFAVKSNLHMTKAEGSFITSTYWGMYTFLRVFSLLAIIYFSPRFLLFVDFCIIMVSNVILVPFGNHYRWALWTGTALMGLGCSSVFATVFAFLEQLTPVTSTITAGFMVAACMGEFIIPLTVGTFLEDYPPIFLWVVLLYASVSFMLVLVLFAIQWKLLRNQRKKEARQIELRPSNLASFKIDERKKY